MITIKVKTSTRYGINSLIYKNGRKKEAEIYQAFNGKFRALCAFAGTSCACFEYDTIEKAKEKTHNYLNNIHQFAGGAEIIYC